jgi:ribosome-binding protein aMBF1 (putative translation factor)
VTICTDTPAPSPKLRLSCCGGVDRVCRVPSSRTRHTADAAAAVPGRTSRDFSSRGTLSDMPGRTTTAEQLRRALRQAERRGVSLRELSRLAGVNVSVVSRFVDGGAMPRLDTAEALAAAVGKRLTLR